MQGSFRWFVLAIVALFVVWVLTGAANNPVNKNTPFMDELSPIGTGKVYTLQQLKDGTRP